MSPTRQTGEDVAPPAERPTFDPDLNFLSRWAGPLKLLARAMLAYIFIVEGVGKIASYAGVADYMQSHGIDGRLLPLVILAELGGGLLVLSTAAIVTTRIRFRMNLLPALRPGQDIGGRSRWACPGVGATHRLPIYRSAGGGYARSGGPTSTHDTPGHALHSPQ